MIDADEFKKALLREARRDGSYETAIKPEEIRSREARGESFYPLELASLVHEESSILAKQLRTEAIARGDNIVVDTVLSNPRGALALGRELSDAGYQISVVDVEVPYEVAEERIRGRWREAAERAAAGGDELGGRWVPSEYAREVFDGPNGESRPMASARQLAQDCDAVVRYRVFWTAAQAAAQQGKAPSKLIVDQSRPAPGGDLVETNLSGVQRTAEASRGVPRRRPPSVER